MMNKKRFSIALDPEMIDEAQRIADSEGCDRADVLRRWLIKGRKEEEGERK